MVKTYIYCIFALYLEIFYISIMIKVSEIAKKKVVELMKDEGYNYATDYIPRDI